jgi:hypothetical protein
VGRVGGGVSRQRGRIDDQPILRLLTDRDGPCGNAIKAGDLGLGIPCGVESMSRSGWAYMKGDGPFTPRGPVLLLDTMCVCGGGRANPALLASNAYISMIETAQNVADRDGLTSPSFRLTSHRSISPVYQGYNLLTHTLAKYKGTQ